MDRIDIHMQVPRVEYQKLRDMRKGESSAEVRVRVEAALERQRERFRGMGIAYEKRGNAENYIKEAKYDMAVGRLLLKSFWANETIFQLMMLSYNLFLLFKFDFLGIS